MLEPKEQKLLEESQENLPSYRNNALRTLAAIAVSVMLLIVVHTTWLQVVCIYALGLSTIILLIEGGEYISAKHAIRLLEHKSTDPSLSMLNTEYEMLVKEQNHS